MLNEVTLRFKETKMPSSAYDIFEKYTVREVNGLIQIFRERNLARGPNVNYGLLHGGLILLVSGWEAYCEDVSKEAVGKIANTTRLRFDDLSEFQRRMILKDAASVNIERVDPLETKLARLVGDGWKLLMVEMMSDYLSEFNSPQFIRQRGGKNLKELFKMYLTNNVSEEISRLTGIDDLANAIDSMVKVRGAIAHRGEPDAVDHFAADGLQLYLNNTRAACAAVEQIIQSELMNRFQITPWRITARISDQLPNR
jgi:RiboL-PSP-HEPN